MTDSVDPRKLVRQGHLNTVKNFFKEPYFASMPEDLVKKCEELYDIAMLEEPEDPVAWIQDFNAQHPVNFEMADEETRIGKILECAKIALKKDAAKEAKENK